MNFHEYQAKALFAAYGIPVPRGELARSSTRQSMRPAGRWQRVGGQGQVHAGGRGKAGGVKLAYSLDEVRALAENMLGMKSRPIRPAAARCR